MIAAALAAWLMLFPASAAESASIEGVVLRLGSDEPVRDARVVLKPATKGGSSPPNVTVKTDSQGQFRFDGVSPGTFRIEFRAEGYARMQFGQRTPTGLEGTPNDANLGTMLTVRAGEKLQGLVQRLTPTGSISGLLLDFSGQPVVDAAVFLLRPVYTATGSKSWLSVGQTESNDRGEYRFYWITPGRYYLAFTYPGDTFEAFESYSPHARQNVLPVRFFPGVSELDAARFIVVNPASELTGVDMVIDVGMLRSIRGRVTPVSIQQGVPESHSVEVYYVSTGQVQKQAYFKFTDDFNSIDGSFAFNNVPPGTYLLAADGAAPVRVTVSNADVEGVLLTRGPPTFVPLTIVVEEGASSTSAGLDGAIMLQGFIEGIGTPSKQSDITAEAEDGGPLRFEVLNTTYRLAFSQPLPAGLYVKEATFRGQDALREVLRFSDTSAGELRVVFGSHPGRIEGSIVDDGQHPAAGRTVALIPRDHRERPDLVRSVATDDAGRFVFRDVAPGDYRLIAWEEIEPYSWFDPDDIADSAADAIAIQIKESSNEKINLRFERAPGEQRARMRAVRDLPMEN